jgi:GAF domain-containing protein
MEYCPWRKNLRVTRANVEDLAAASALSVATIRRAELKENQTALTSANDLAIRRALESAGVEFIDENGGGLGVIQETLSGKNVDWLEKVSDEQYRK